MFLVESASTQTKKKWPIVTIVFVLYVASQLGSFQPDDMNFFARALKASLFYSLFTMQIWMKPSPKEPPGLRIFGFPRPKR